MKIGNANVFSCAEPEKQILSLKAYVVWVQTRSPKPLPAERIQAYRNLACDILNSSSAAKTPLSKKTVFQTCTFFALQRPKVKGASYILQ
jgi:hypothetical protein